MTSDAGEELDESDFGDSPWAQHMAKMTDLMAAQAAYEEIDAARRRAVEVRDEAVRQALDAGWRYIDVIAKTRLSSPSIANIRKRAPGAGAGNGVSALESSSGPTPQP